MNVPPEVSVLVVVNDGCDVPCEFTVPRTPLYGVANTVVMGSPGLKAITLSVATLDRPDPPVSNINCVNAPPML